jgi:hypothetical protein
MAPDKVKFPPVEEFPLYHFAWLQADGGRQRQGKIHIQSRILSARTNRLDPQRKGRWHYLFGLDCSFLLAFLRLVYRLASW